MYRRRLQLLCIHQMQILYYAVNRKKSELPITLNSNHKESCVLIMYKNVFCFTSSNITICLFLALSVTVLCPVSIIRDSGGEPQIFEVGPNSTPQIKNSTYENSSLGISIEHPVNWKPFEKTSAATNSNVVEFVPFVESEHDPLTPFFSISVENLEEVKVSQKVGDEAASTIDSNNNNALGILTKRNLELAESLPDFNIVELNGTSFLSGIPAYRIVYTFADPGSPLLPLFESMNIWAVKDDKAYTISYSAPDSEFSNYFQIIQNMIDSFIIGDRFFYNRR